MGGLAKAGVAIVSGQHKVAIQGAPAAGIAIAGQAVWSASAAGWRMIASTNVSQVGMITPPIDTTGADLLVAGVAAFSASIPGTGIEDNRGNVWTRLLAQRGAEQAMIFWSKPTSVGPGHTFRALPSTGAWFPSLAVVAAAGSGPTQPDQHAVSAVGQNNTVTITPSAAGAAVFSVTCMNSTPTGVAPPFGVVVLSPYVSGAAMGCGVGVCVQAAPAAVTATWSGDQPFITAAASFFAA